MKEERARRMETAKALALNHLCEPQKYCGLAQDIEYELEQAERRGVDFACDQVSKIFELKGYEKRILQRWKKAQ